jgi:Leucine-rich repeat (LRR) protein
MLTLNASAQVRKIRPEVKINLSGHQLRSVPDSVFEKTSTTYLDLGSSKIIFYPPLSALIDTNANHISAISASIAKLVHLKTLILNSNDLTTLPYSIVQLTNLELLDLSQNKEFDLVKELGKLKKLKQLKVLKIVDVKLAKGGIDIIKKNLPGTKIISTIPEYFESIK